MFDFSVAGMKVASITVAPTAKALPKKRTISPSKEKLPDSTGQKRPRRSCDLRGLFASYPLQWLSCRDAGAEEARLAIKANCMGQLHLWGSLIANRNVHEPGGAHRRYVIGHLLRSRHTGRPGCSVGPGLFTEATLRHHVRERQLTARTQHAKRLAEHGGLVGAEV